MADQDDDEVISLRSQWYTLYMTWQVLHWCGIFVISGGSAVVASKWHGGDSHDGVALVVAVTSALYAVLEPARRAYSYRQAWVGLNMAHFRERDLSETTLRAIEHGEGLIAGQAAPKATQM